MSQINQPLSQIPTTAFIFSDVNGTILSKELYFCKKGCPHGYYLNYQKQDCNEFCHFGLYLNGTPVGPEWTCIPPGTYIFKNHPTLTQQVQEEEKNNAIFIYPDVHTALFGIFEPQCPFMIIEAFVCEISSINITQFGILQPMTNNKDSGLKNLARDDQIDPISICTQPLLEDPYEQRLVEVKKSLIPNAGQGLFAKRSIDKGQIVAYFHGIPSVSSMYCKYSEYSISHDGTTDMIDIPENCRNTETYCATLAHKICHSFGPNAQYSYAFHPRFGRIRCVTAIKYIQKEEEITCNYKYKLEKAPEWYKEDLKMFLKNKHDYELSDSEINQILTSSIPE